MARTVFDRMLDHSEEAIGWLADSIKTAQNALDEMQMAQLEVRRLNRAACAARRTEKREAA